MKQNQFNFIPNKLNIQFSINLHIFITNKLVPSICQNIIRKRKTKKLKFNTNWQEQKYGSYISIHTRTHTYVQFNNIFWICKKKKKQYMHKVKKI